MSTGLAIGAVSAVLRSLLLNELADPALSGVIGRIDVTALPPDRIRTGEPDEHAQLNLMLYQVTPNPGWRNANLPSIAGDGARVASPPLAIDLHYLLCAYVGQDLDAEILLGLGMQVLHENPVLSRELIRRSLPSAGGARPAALAASGLAEQVEQITVTPQALSPDEVSRLWSATQSRFRPSFGYHVSVVLIERQRPARAVHPVRSRRIVTVPGHPPRVARVAAAHDPGAPLVPGTVVTVEGSDLAGDGVRVRLGGVGLPTTTIGANELRATLDGPELRAGVAALDVIRPVLRRPAPDHDLETGSNVVALVLHPAITVTPGTTDLTVGFTPPLGARQRVELVLNRRENGLAYRIDAPSPRAEGTTSATVQVTDVPHGRYTVQAIVDGADSLADAAPEVEL